jgi:excisionase family DNA binding protein
MSTSSSISGHYSSTQAAQLLGVTDHEIARLVRDGELSAINAAGRAFLLSANEVHLYASIRQGKGRPLSASIAWAALWLLSGLDTDWLDYSQMRRLRIKLKNITPEELVWQTRKRMSTKRFRVSQSFIPKLREELILTGRSCISDLNSELTEQKEVLEGYARLSLHDLEKKYHLVEDMAGSAIIHTVEGEQQMLDGIGQAPIAVVAADLAFTLDTRERRAGLDVLRRLIDEFKEA